MAYTTTNPILGTLNMAQIDDGIIPPNNISLGVTTTIPTPPLATGMVVNAIDPTFGGGEFVLLKGVGSLLVGSLVTYDFTSGATALTVAATDKFTAVPVAVSMAANTDTAKWSWFQIGGLAVVKKTAVAVAPHIILGMSATPGRVKVIVSGGMAIEGAQSANLATVTTTTSTITMLIDRPHIMGPATLA